MLIDAHAHLDRYENVLGFALSEIAEHRVFTIGNSMDILSYERNLEIGEVCDLVLPTFGVHPRRAPQYADRLEDLAKHIRSSAMIGEIGLDFHWVKDPSEYTGQKRVFDYFLAAAREQNKTVNLHTKGAEQEILDMLGAYEIEKAIIHWYSGPLDILKAMVNRGWHFTVGVEVMRSEHIRTIVRLVPVGQLLTETDNPGGQKWLTGSLGMPGLILDVVREISEIKKIHPEELAQVIEENFARLIRHDPYLTHVYDKFFSKLQNVNP
ncbi:MAG: TatD family hydrolase [Candidatus Binatia bacterium]|jgi:TatD DNase family protein|nr:TatD family hydrolase [Candidatus Binatia bacterium]